MLLREAIARYNITLREGLTEVEYDALSNCEDFCPTRSLFGGFDPVHRSLAVGSDWHPERHPIRTTVLLLHELAHCLCYIPWTDVESVHEDWILLPVERALARICSDVDWGCYDDLLGTTRIRAEGNIFWDQIVGRRTETAWWRRAVARAQRVGLLLPDGSPSFQWADWSKLLPEDLLELDRRMYAVVYGG